MWALLRGPGWGRLVGVSETTTGTDAADSASGASPATLAPVPFRADATAVAKAVVPVDGSGVVASLSAAAMAAACARLAAATVTLNCERKKGRM